MSAFPPLAPLPDPTCASRWRRFAVAAARSRLGMPSTRHPIALLARRARAAHGLRRSHAPLQ